MLFWKKKPKPKTQARPITAAPKERVPVRTEEPKNEKHRSPRESKQKAPSKRHVPEKEFLRIFKQLTYRHRSWDVWRDFVTMFACAVSNAVDKSHYDEREALYMKTIKKYNKEEQQLFPELTAETVLALENDPEQDFLGHIYMQLNLGNEAGGQFFTPYCICECMASITMGDVPAQVEEKGYITISDPCCGAGATLIAGIHEARKQLDKAGLNFQNHLLIAAQDIDYTTALMCYLQLSLLGVAAYVKIGNTLTDPMCSADTLENYWFTPIYFTDVWMLRRLFHGGKIDE